MPIPLFFIGVAVVTGTAGIGTTAKAGVNTFKAKTLNDTANQKMEDAANRLNASRIQCGKALNNLGEIKICILNDDINSFINSFRKIKNVDFSESDGILEIHKLKVDQKDFDELTEMTKFSLSLAEGGVAGATGGAVAAFGAYSAAATFASASTGTAIASLSGAAASNATLAFFGGGSLATGGLGMAGGTAVLGGLVAGPALLVMGVITSKKAGKSLEEAYANSTKSEETCAELETGVIQCIAIRRKCMMYYNLLARLESKLRYLQKKMDDIIQEEGIDYSTYKRDSKKSIAAIVSLVGTIKAVLDTPILSEDGMLTEESEVLLKELEIK